MWWSTASRAMNSRMISLDPSKIRLMRESRIVRSTGIGVLAARAQRLRRLVAAPAADLQRVVHDRASRLPCSTASRSRPRAGCRSRPARTAASRARRSLPSRTWSPPSARSCARPPRACRSAAPHCTRSVAHVRDDFEQRLRRPPHTLAGIVSRPVLSVVSASFSPLPSPHSMFSRGHAHVREPDDAVLDRLEPHEPAAQHDFDARHVPLDDERRDLLARLPRYHDDPACAPSPRTARPAVPLVHHSFSPLMM